MSEFGQIFKQFRVGRGETLRTFCLKNRFDPIVISKLERGVLPSPGDKDLHDYALALGISESSTEWGQFFDAAKKSKELTVPYGEAEILRKLPVIFRTADNNELTEDKLNEVVEVVKDSYQ